MVRRWFWLWLLLLWTVTTTAQQRGTVLDSGYTSLDLARLANVQTLRTRGILNWYLLLPKVNDIGSSDGAVVVRDLTPQRHQGAYAGMPTAPTSASGPGRTDRPAGYAQVNFNGTGGYVNLGTTTVTLTKAFSVASWINIADTTHNSYVIWGISYTDTAHSYGLFMHRTDKSGLTFQYSDSGSSAAFPPNASKNLTANVWTRVVLAVDPPNSTVDIYMDALRVTHTTTFTMVPLDLGQGMAWGCWGTNTPVSNFFKGAMDDLQIFDHMLTAPEVEADYGRSQQRYPVLLQRLGVQWARPGTSASPIGVFFPWFQ